MREWLLEHHPGKLEQVMSLVAVTRGGKDYDARLGSARMSGTGPYAWMIGRRFEIAARKLGFNGEVKLRTDLFERPREVGAELALF